MKLFCLMICLGMCLCSCEQRPDMNCYIETVKHGLTVVQESNEIEAMLGDSDHFITHFGAGKQPLIWNTEVYFGGGYCLTMQVDVIADYDACKVDMMVGDMRFHLVEYGVIEERGGGQMSASIVSDIAFSSSEWKTIVQNNGDFSVLDITVKHNFIPGFSKYVASIRSARICVK